MILTNQDQQTSLLFWFFLKCLWIFLSTHYIPLHYNIFFYFTRFLRELLRIISNDHRNTRHTVVALKGIKQILHSKKYKTNIPTNQICSAFYIVPNETYCELSVARFLLPSPSLSLSLPSFICFDCLFMTATIEIQNKIQALNFTHTHHMDICHSSAVCACSYTFLSNCVFILLFGKWLKKPVTSTLQQQKMIDDLVKEPHEWIRI